LSETAIHQSLHSCHAKRRLRCRISRGA